MWKTPNKKGSVTIHRKSIHYKHNSTIDIMLCHRRQIFSRSIVITTVNPLNKLCPRAVLKRDVDFF
jgi:hypothetical protein